MSHSKLERAWKLTEKGREFLRKRHEEYMVKSAAKTLKKIMDAPDPWAKYGTDTEPVEMIRKQFLAAVREVLKDMDGLLNGDILSVKPCEKCNSCFVCDDFFLCAYKKYAESEPDEIVTSCKYAFDLLKDKDEPPTL